MASPGMADWQRLHVLSISRARADLRGAAVAGAVPCAYSNTYRWARPLEAYSSRLSAVSRVRRPRSFRGGGQRTNSRPRHCWTVYLSGLGDVDLSGLTRQSRRLMSGGVGKVLWTDGPVWCVGSSGNSWRGRRARVRRGAGQHMLHRIRGRRVSEWCLQVRLTRPSWRPGE